MARPAVLLLLVAAAAAEDAIEEGRALLDGPDREKGLALIREGIGKLEKEPATARTLHRIGLGWFYLEEDAKAKAAFAKAAELAPKEPEHVFMLAIVLMYGDLPEAARTMRKAIDLAPESARYRCGMGRILVLQKKEAEGLASFLEACRLDPGYAEAHHKAATLLAGAGKEEEALAHFLAAAEAEPTLVDAWYNAAQICYNRAEFERALELWSRAAELAPDDYQVRTKLVQACYALGRYGDAEPHRKRVLELRPGDAREFCFDQFDADGKRVFAYERFDKGGDLYYHFTFKVVAPKGEIERTVNLESSAVLRENGVLFVLGADFPDGVHRTYDAAWRDMPAYPELKKLVIRAAKGEMD